MSALHWVLQDFEDTRTLSEALDRLGQSYTWHKVVPFAGDLIPLPDVEDPSRVVLFGSYALRHAARREGWRPGVWTVRPFSNERPWRPFLLNGPGARVMPLCEVPTRVTPDGAEWFLRPVDDSKAEPGRVRTGEQIAALARKVLALDPDDIPVGSLRPETELMLCPPARIQTEWRLWIVGDRIVTHSLYRDGHRVTYRHEIDEDALAFAREMVAANPLYADAYVLDICRTADGLRLLETNCLNAAGFYAADLHALAAAIVERASC